MDDNKLFRNGTMMQYFHWYLPANCKLWNKVRNESKHLSEIGITATWLPPAYKGNEGNNDVGYTVYDLYDLGEFKQKNSTATKYGTKRQYLNAINSLHKNNIDVYADICLDHKIGADEFEEVYAVEYNPDNRNISTGKSQRILAWTRFNFPVRNNKYSPFKWDYTCFDGVDFDQISSKKSLFRFSNKTWDNYVDGEKGNYDYLMGADVDFNNTNVVKELNAWGEWYLNFTNIDGFRLDAVKHINYKFLKDWVSTLRDKTGKELFSVGEYWNQDINILLNYINSTRSEFSLFDVPLHFNFQKASSSNGDYDMRNILRGTLMERYPTKAVTFIDNHDTQKGQSLESYVLNWFKPIAYSLILLRAEGYPCVFYADYYSDGAENNIPSIKNTLDILIKLRKYSAYGKQTDYFDHPDVIGWTRERDINYENSGLAVIISNGQDGYKDMYIGENFAGDYFYDTLGNRNDLVLIDENGVGQFTVNAGSVSVWIKQ